MGISPWHCHAQLVFYRKHIISISLLIASTNSFNCISNYIYFHKVIHQAFAQTLFPWALKIPLFCLLSNLLFAHRLWLSKPGNIKIWNLRGWHKTGLAYIIAEHMGKPFSLSHSFFSQQQYENNNSFPNRVR